MTTIAYRDGVLASDSRGAAGDCLTGDVAVKLWRFNGWVYGVTGGIAQGEMAVRKMVNADWLSVEVGSETRVIVLRPEGDLAVFEDKGCWSFPRKGFIAFGSGTAPAMAALHMGADPAEAVRIASLVDPWTGGPIVVMKSGEP